MWRVKTVMELCERYGIKKSAFSLFIKLHRDEIDPDRTHITRDGKNVFFDEFSVIQIDKIRGYVTDLSRMIAPAQEAVPAEIIRLQQENNELRDEIIRQLRENSRISAELSEEKQKNAILLTANQNFIAQLETIDRRTSAPMTQAEAWRNWRNRHKKY